MNLLLPIVIVLGIAGGLMVFLTQSNNREVVTSPAPTLQASSPKATEKGTSPMKQFSQAEQVIDQNKSYTAILHTSAGDITLALSKETPITTNNFVFLAQNKFYDGVIFHRVIPDFMIQGGDPTGTGSGGPGYRFADEPFTGEYKRGTLAMANAGPNTNGSQFFIMHADYALPSDYVIFGTTTSGLEVVDKIATAQKGANDRPVAPITIQSVEIIAK